MMVCMPDTSVSDLNSAHVLCLAATMHMGACLAHPLTLRFMVHGCSEDVNDRGS